MNEKDRQLILKIADRLGAIEEELRFMKGSQKPLDPTAIVKLDKSLVGGTAAANKFFGTKVATEPECSVSAELKHNVSLNTEDEAEMRNGQKMLRKSVMDFCEEFDIEKFDITYTDPTPKKDD